MPQLFSEKSNSLFRVALIAFLALVVGFLFTLSAMDQSSYNSRVDHPVEQPLQFSHEHHVAGLGIDCRYCHQTVEASSSAGMPAASICMNCHEHVWKNAPILEPMRASFANGTPIAWRRVYDLPDFTYFNHSIHLAKGIGCETCHGRVDTMPVLWKASNLKMEWCLDCHRDPVKNLRPREAITEMGWQPPGKADRKRYQESLAREYRVRAKIDCYTCHR